MSGTFFKVVSRPPTPPRLAIESIVARGGRFEPRENPPRNEFCRVGYAHRFHSPQTVVQKGNLAKRQGAVRPQAGVIG